MVKSFSGGGGGLFPTTFKSLPVYKGTKTVISATLTATETGTIIYQINATTDESKWETVTNGTEYTLLNSGTQLRWRAVGNVGSTITELKIKYFLSA